MEFTLSRRNFLEAGTGLAINATLAASAGSARAETIVHQRTSGFGQIDRTLRRAVAEKKVAGFWLDPVKRVTGVLFTQVLPFFDPEVPKLYAALERGVYDV